MLRFKLRSSQGLTSNLLALTLGGAATVVPYYAIATLLGAFPAVALVVSGIVGALAMFSILKACRPDVKLLPGAVASVLGGASLGLLFPAHPVLGCLAFGGFFGMAQASGYREWGQKLTLVASGAAAALLGGVVCGMLAGLAVVTAAIPAAALLAGAGGLFGFYIGLSSLPAHVKVRHDLVGTRYAQLMAGSRPEIRDFLSRVYALSTRVEKSLGAEFGFSEEQEEHFSEDLENIMLKIFSLAGKWQEIEVYLTGFQSGDMDQRIQQIEDKIRSAGDSQVAAQYQKTRETLLQRRDDHQEIVKARERIVSNLTYYHAKMEALSLTLMRVRCVETQDVSMEIDGLLRNVGQLTDEMDAATRSLDDLTRPAAALPTA
ncbi:MAG: hypothetical protein HY815_20525 [Candidatus Riflebacteria bacterium]|nr:hypothetical protein [Candidatus Riflebacteria bacterium]